MSLRDSITDLVTDTVTVQRRMKGTWVDGIYTLASPTTFTADVVMQPAFGLNRVVGGADLHGREDNQSATDVRDFFTLTEIRTLSKTTDPDVILGFEDSDWTVARVERWPDLEGGVYFRAIITKITNGAS